MNLTEVISNCLSLMEEFDDKHTFWIRPKGWNGKGIAIELRCGTLWVIPIDSEVVPYHPTIGEILATWEIVTPETVLPERESQI